VPVLYPAGLRVELEDVTYKGVPLKPADVDRLYELLACGQSRPDGLPAYRPGGWGSDRREPAKPVRPNAMVRRVEAAVACDLGDFDMIEVSAKVLGLRDHVRPNLATFGEPRKAREYRKAGRELLARLGAWPWAHAPLGRLPKGWRADAAFIEPLRVWFERAIAARKQELRRCEFRWWYSTETGGHLPRSDALKLPPEGAPRRVDPTELPPKPHTASMIREQEEADRIFDAFDVEQKKLHAAREQARAARRPVR
jgi:hypothetical protein